MSTRVSAKQQELEEQLARLLSTMELQQQRQEQLAWEQQQRQEEQLSCLLEEQQQLLKMQQCKAEEQMGATLSRQRVPWRDGFWLPKHHWKECTKT